MSFIVDGDDRYRTAAASELFAIIEDRVVFHRSGYDVPSLRRHLERGMNRRVIGFGAATSENDFVRLTTEKRRDPGASQLGRVFHLRAKTMRARGIAVMTGEKWHHLLQHLGINLGARVVVEINDFRIGRHI